MSKVILLLALALPHARARARTPRASRCRPAMRTRARPRPTCTAATARSTSRSRDRSGSSSRAASSRAAWTAPTIDRGDAARGAALRLAARRLTPFVHALGGVVRESSGVDVFDVSIREKRTDAAGALGAGVDVPLGRSWALRVQGDYIVRGGEDSEASRASAGIVYRAGAR